MMVATKIVVESTEAAMEETGDLKIPEQEGFLTQDMLHAELGDIVAGRKQGRTDEKEVTLFKSVGLAIVDIVVANYFYKKAQKKKKSGWDINIYFKLHSYIGSR